MILLIFVLELFGSQAVAVEFLTKKMPECSCRKEVKDPFEISLVFNFGKFKGQCIDSCRNRPAKIIKIEQGSHFHVANILHYGTFYRSRLNINKVENVFIGFEEFLPGISHVFLKFQFKESEDPLILFDQSATKMESIQNPKEKLSVPLKVRNLVISPEGISSKGNSYNLVESLMGEYLMVYRVLTDLEMFRQAEEKHNKIRMYKLALDHKQAAKVLHEALVKSDSMKLENIYQLLYNNCATTAFSLIESGVGRLLDPNDAFLKFQLALPIVGPIGTLQVMNHLNLVK